MIKLADNHAQPRHGTQGVVRVRGISLLLVCVCVCVLHCTSTAARDDGMMQDESIWMIAIRL